MIDEPKNKLSGYDNFENESEEKFEVSMLSRILRGVIAFVALIGLLHLSGINQFLRYQRTPESQEQTPIEALVDARTLTVPLTLFIVTGNNSYGSVRSEENALNLVENASRIWDQAGIVLEISAIHTLVKSDDEIHIFFNNIGAFIQKIEAFDSGTINVFLLGTLGGINGIAFGGLRSVAVADYTTVYDFRALAHEVGHILGLSHVGESRGQLMYRGANGFELSLEEIERARIQASLFGTVQ